VNYQSSNYIIILKIKFKKNLRIHTLTMPKSVILAIAALIVVAAANLPSGNSISRRLNVGS
jgi:hypothetical protein